MAETAYNSKRILNKVQQQIIAKGRKWASQQIDPEATADRDAVAAAVRGLWRLRLGLLLVLGPLSLVLDGTLGGGSGPSAPR